MTKSGRRLLLVGEDATLGQALGDHLAASGFTVILAAPAEAVAAAAAADVVVLDGEIGEALCHQLKRHATAPVVVLARPVRLAALAARIEDLLSRRTCFAIGGWRLDAAARSLDDGAGRRLRLTDKEVAILRLLKQSDGVVSRQRLLAEVWGHAALLATHTLETHIYRLRRKIEADPASPALLLTEPGGYRLAE